MLDRFATPGLLLVLTVAFGFWLSSQGKPYNGLLFNVHKLFALGAVVLMVLQFSKSMESLHLNTLIITLLVVSAICAVALFASGALMSLGKLDYTIVLLVHRIAMTTLVLVLILSVYLLIGNKYG
ncbi:MAG: hypothetical protein JXB15_07865 [Anaerolineales bacterium]|nr:hypothetical protein [Anaerolineales bacterium]